MSWYKSFIIIPLMLSGCAARDSIIKFNPDANQTEIQKNIAIANKPVATKAIGNEDILIVAALLYQEKREYAKVAFLYQELYELTGKKEYLNEAISFLTYTKNFDKVDSLIKTGLKQYPNDTRLLRYEIGVLLDKKEYAKAEDNINKILKTKRNPHLLVIAATIYKLQKKYDKSKSFYEEAYEKEPKISTLRALVTLMYTDMKDLKGATSLLEKNIQKGKCDRGMCYLLADMYAKSKDMDGLERVYTKLYEDYGELSVGKKIVEIYLYQNKQSEAISFVKKHNMGDDILMDLHVTFKEYAPALEIATRLYTQTKDYEYLAKMAIFEYEGATLKDEALLNSVGKKFDEVVTHLNKGLYLNYYGYLLIDHDIDYPKGIKLVQQALKDDPKSYFYIDSLAWGYYKNKECKKALTTIKKAYALSRDEEIVEHYEKIKECSKK